MMVLQLLYCVFMMSVYPVPWLIDSELGGAHGWSGVGLKLRTSILIVFYSNFCSGAASGAGREGTRRAHDGPGERPAGRRGGCII